MHVTGVCSTRNVQMVHTLGAERDERTDTGKKVAPVIDRTYRLRDVPEAIRYLETGRARGKVIVTVADEN